MKRWIVATSLAAALALPLMLAPSAASASCADRKVTGTVVGGLSGALIGNAIAGGGGGAVVGGLGGAVLGHQAGKSTCGRGVRRADTGAYARQGGYERRSRYRHRDDARGHASMAAASQPATGGPAAGACRTVLVSYYDDRGVLVQQPSQTCAP